MISGIFIKILSISLLIIVGIILILGMGYARQGLAFSFSLFLIKALEDKRLFKSITNNHCRIKIKKKGD